MDMTTPLLHNFMLRAEKIEELAIALESELADLDSVNTVEEEEKNNTNFKAEQQSSGELRKQIRTMDMERRALREENLKLKAKVKEITEQMSRSLESANAEGMIFKGQITELESENDRLTRLNGSGKEETMAKTEEFKNLELKVFNLEKEKEALLQELEECTLPLGMTRSGVLASLSSIREEIVKIQEEKDKIELKNTELQEQLDCLIEQNNSTVSNSPKKAVTDVDRAGGPLSETTADRVELRELVKENSSKEGEHQPNNNEATNVTKPNTHSEANEVTELRQQVQELEDTNGRITQETKQLKEKQNEMIPVSDMDAFKEETFNQVSEIRRALVKLQEENNELKQKKDVYESFKETTKHQLNHIRTLVLTLEKENAQLKAKLQQQKQCP